jgi:hypothetical protein
MDGRTPTKRVLPEHGELCFGVRLGIINKTFKACTCLVVQYLLTP